MKTIDRYIYREFAFFFLMFIVGFVILMLGNTLFLLSDLIYTRKIPVGIVTQIILLRAPANAVLGFPVATLFASLLSVGRLGRDSEIVAMLSGGISRARIILPIFLLSTGVCLLTFFLNDTMVPEANHKSQNYIRRFYLADVVESARSNVFFHLSDDVVMYTGSMDENSQKMDNIVLFDIDQMGFPTINIVESGQFDGDNIHLNNGVTFEFDRNADSRSSARFNSVVRDISREFDDTPVDAYTPPEITTIKLRKMIEGFRENGVEPHGLVTDYYFKYSIPAANIVLGLIGVLFAAFTPRKEMAAGVIFAIVCLSIYWVLMTFMRSLGHDGIIPSWLAAWGQNLIFLGIVLPLLAFIRR